MFLNKGTIYKGKDRFEGNQKGMMWYLRAQEVVTRIQKGEYSDLAQPELFDAPLTVQTHSPWTTQPEEESEEWIWRGK